MTHTRVVPDCADVAEAVSRGEPLSAEAQAHVSHCRVCQASRDAARPASGDALFARVEAAIGEERGLLARLRSLPTGLRVLGAVAWAVIIVLASTLATPRSAYGPVPAQYLVLAVTVLAILTALAVRLDLRPLQVVPSGHASVLGMIAVGLAVPVALAVLPAPGPQVTSLPGVGDTPAIVGCFLIGCGAGTLLILGLRALDRGAHRSPTNVLLAAAAGGLLGNAALELHCPITTTVHLLLGHATVGIALAAAYGIAALRLTRRTA